MAVHTPPLGRVLEKIEVRPNGCWLFTGKLNRYGYGKICNLGRDLMAHRVTHEGLKGPIPEGVGLDHICHDPKTCRGGRACVHRRCVNPEHTVPASAKDNNSSARSVKTGAGINLANAASAISRRARTHCKNGHLWDSPENFFYSGQRVCKECARGRARAYGLRQRKAA